LLSGCASISRWFNGLADNKVQPAATKSQAQKTDTKTEHTVATKSVAANKNTEKKSPSKKELEKKAYNSQFSGWLVDYTNMKEHKTATGGTSLLWVSPELKKGKYTAIIIDPIGLYPRPPLLAKVSKGRMLEALTYIHTRAVNQLGSTLKIVDKPGPSVLRLDAAITGVKTTAEKDKLHDAKNIPVAMIFSDMSPATAQPEQSLVVFLEARLRDSQTNKTLVKAVRAGTGSPAGKDKVTVEQMKPVLNSWVQDADAFVRESVK
jgi:hypothetical protein